MDIAICLINKNIVAINIGITIPVNGTIKILEVLHNCGIEEKIDAIKYWRTELGL